MVFQSKEDLKSFFFFLSAAFIYPEIFLLIIALALFSEEFNFLTERFLLYCNNKLTVQYIVRILKLQQLGRE